MLDIGGHEMERFVGSSGGIHFIRNVHVMTTYKNARSLSSETLEEIVFGEDDYI
jgi:hypothetical protein